MEGMWVFELLFLGRVFVVVRGVGIGFLYRCEIWFCFFKFLKLWFYL